MKAIVHVSGGLDSAASFICAGREYGYENVLPVFYDYGQPYLVPEQVAAHMLCEKMNMTLEVYKLPMLVDEKFPVPEYVPYRNLILCAHSANLATALNAEVVVTGSKSMLPKKGDARHFKDSSLRPFTVGLNNFLETITEPGVKAPVVVMPLAGWSKAQVVRFLLDNNVNPDDLWTCYGLGPKPCGNCLHCEDYAEAKAELAL